MRYAFTLIELLIVIAISALFSGLAITYSSVGREQLALTVEESKISQFILQAKALSIATYTSPSGISSCAYGISFDITNQTYSIFSYNPAGAPPCPQASDITSIDPTEESMYTQETWQVPVSSGVKIESPNASMAILFYPPDPTVYLSPDGTTIQPGGSLPIKLEELDDSTTVTITVNPEGQVSF